MIECVLVVLNNVNILYFQWPKVKKNKNKWKQQQQTNKIKQNKKVVLHVAPKKKKKC